MAAKKGQKTSKAKDRPLAPARARPTLDLAKRFAALLSEPYSHQLGVCAQLSIPYSTYKDWMAHKEPSPELAQFQAIVLQALDAARVRDIKDARSDIASSQGATCVAFANMHKFHHERRFKRFYQSDEEPKTVKQEITGKDGGPIQSESKVITQDAAQTIARKVLFGEAE